MALVHRSRALIVVSWFVALAAHQASAADYYVSPTGNDGNSGTVESQAFQTIQQGVSVARAGDTVFVMDGTYTGPMAMRFSGSPGNPITLRNLPGHRPVIRFADITNVNDTLRVVHPNGAPDQTGWVTIEGLEITGG